MFRESQGFFLIYSVTSRSSFDGVDAYHTHLLRHYAPSTHGKDPKEKPVFLLVGNKSDRADQREISQEEGRAKARKLGCEFFETSAKTAMNLERIFLNIVRQLRVKGRQTGVKVPQTHSRGKAKKYINRHCVVL